MSPSLRYAANSGAFLLPAAWSPASAGMPPAHDEARSLLTLDPDAAASLLDQLIFEAEPGQSHLLTALRVDASVAALRRGEPTRALERLAEVPADSPLADHARLNRVRAWLELGLPDGTAERAAAEAELLRSGPLGLEARLVLAVIQAWRGATAECRATVAGLDAETLPEGLGLIHQVNAGVVLLEANDILGALERFDRAELLAATATALELAVVALNHGTALGVLAAQTGGNAERAAMFAEAGRLLDRAATTLRRLRAPDRLLADCRRNRGVVRLWGGSRAGSPQSMEGALRDHWSALELYGRRPEWGRLAGGQWGTLGLCYRVRRSPGDDDRAQRCFDRAEELLDTSGDPRALAERDLAEASLRVGADPNAALALALPAAILMDSERFRLAGADARGRWSDGAAEDAFHDALAAARGARRNDVVAALVVWRRFGGATQFEREGPLPATAAEASVLTPPPGIRGVAEVLAPYMAEASRRFAVTNAELLAPTTIDLLG